jgi:hypothetical protein
MFRTTGLIMHFPTLVSRSPRLKAIVVLIHRPYVDNRPSCLRAPVFPSRVRDKLLASYFNMSDN